MVNEFAYCRRLFFLEWVQARFADNDDTVEGRYPAPARSIAKGGVPRCPPMVISGRTRSLLLSSPRLGLVGRIDVVEGGAGGAVRPVDIKRGRPPDNEDRSWEPERVQLCVQGLLLRDAGYACDEGILYFAESTTRVTVPFSCGAGRAHTLARRRDANGRSVGRRAPPPLVASPKCPRCSLVGICLPGRDERARGPFGSTRRDV
ncbi:MAG: hypothetical protein KatS3mg010_1655 [Acidimicrobiia bacterium]|nr:MAG: hypothetical protein KatS3mg010_1655 [Acidimicrobiia bacterium]